MSHFDLFPFLQTALSLLAALLAILLVIVVHELGHFSVARWCGIKVHRFSIGFGKILWSRTDKQGTLYTFCLLPLGGYVKMLGEGHEAILEEEKAFAFNHKPLLVRAAVVFAGPFINFILAIFLFWIVFQVGVQHINPIIGKVVPHSIAAKAGLKAGDEIKQIGKLPVREWQTVLMSLLLHVGDQGSLNVVVQAKNSKNLSTHTLNLNTWVIDEKNPQLFESLGLIPFQPKIKAIVGSVEPDSPAAQIGLLPGDQLLGFNHHYLDDWLAMVQFLQHHPDQKLVIGIERAHHRQWLKVQLGHMSLPNDQVGGYLGVRIQQPEWPLDVMQWKRYSFIGAFPQALAQTAELSLLNGIVLVKMLGAKLSLHSLGGPISIFESASHAFQIGLTAYLGFIAFVSISLGFINLLPIPCLDGGYLLFFLIEGIFRRPIPERYQIALMRLGLLLIVLLMTQAIINDVLRL